MSRTYELPDISVQLLFLGHLYREGEKAKKYIN